MGQCSFPHPQPLGAHARRARVTVYLPTTGQTAREPSLFRGAQPAANSRPTLARCAQFGGHTPSVGEGVRGREPEIASPIQTPGKVAGLARKANAFMSGWEVTGNNGQERLGWP